LCWRQQYVLPTARASTGASRRLCDRAGAAAAGTAASRALRVPPSIAAAGTAAGRALRVPPSIADVGRPSARPGAFELIGRQLSNILGTRASLTVAKGQPRGVIRYILMSDNVYYVNLSTLPPIGPNAGRLARIFARVRCEAVQGAESARTSDRRPAEAYVQVVEQVGGTRPCRLGALHRRSKSLVRDAG
jgi:hypothetical protein